MKNYNKLKEIICKANEFKFLVSSCKYENYIKVDYKEWYDVDLPITLADILIVLSEYNSNIKNKTLSLRFYYADGLQIEQEGKILLVWDLRNDLDGQYNTLKQSLINLLVK